MAADLEPIETSFWAGALECLANDELALFLDVTLPADDAVERSNLVRTYSTTGVPISEVTPPGEWTSLHVLGDDGDRSIAVAHLRFVHQQLMIHNPGGGWSLVGPVMSPDSRPVLLDGQLYDAGPAMAAIDPGGVEVPRIEISHEG